jgi:hypothetical protein
MKQPQKALLKFIYENEVSKDVKDEMEIVFPKQFAQKPKPRNGWYKDPQYPEWLGFFEAGVCVYGIDSSGDWFDNYYHYKGIDREEKATDEEVVIALDKIRIEKGLVSGAVAKSAFNDKISEIKCKGLYMISIENLVSDRADECSISLMYKGEWATVIEEPKTDINKEQSERLEKFLNNLNKANEIAMKAVEKWNKSIK